MPFRNIWNKWKERLTENNFVEENIELKNKFKKSKLEFALKKVQFNRLRSCKNFIVSYPFKLKNFLNVLIFEFRKKLKSALY